MGVAGALLGKCSSREFVDAKDKYGDTALHIASRQGYKDLVKALLDHKANKEIMNQVRGSTCCKRVVRVASLQLEFIL